MTYYSGLLNTRAADEGMVAFTRPPEIVREIDFPSMSASELRDTRAILARLLADVDRRLEAVAASDQPDDDPTLARRVRAAKRALSDASNGKPDAAVQARVDEVKRAWRAKR